MLFNVIQFITVAHSSFHRKDDGRTVFGIFPFHGADCYVMRSLRSLHRAQLQCRRARDVFIVSGLGINMRSFL